MRHHDIVIEHVRLVDINERQRRILKERNLDVDALNLINLAVHQSRVPKQKKCTPGEYVDERFSEAVLFTHATMLKTLQDREDLKQYKALAKISKPLEAAERETMNHYDKPQNHTPQDCQNGGDSVEGSA